MKRRALGTFAIAKICQVTPMTVARWLDENKLPSFTTGGGHRRVWDEDLLKFLKAHNMPSPAHLSKTAVVIVDDDRLFRKLIRRVFEKAHPDLDLYEAVDGYEAGELITSLVPSLVVLDIRLPGMDGFKVCQRIRQSPSLKKVKIIAISGLPAKGTEEKILKAGADVFLEKSQGEDKLLALAEELLGLSGRVSA